MQDIAGLNVGVVVAVGEKIAQQLLASTQSLEILRGKMHDTNGLQVVATYHPDDLLLHLHNKAKTWDDLCMAIDAISR
jgi:DNA polymerase